MKRALFLMVVAVLAGCASTREPAPEEPSAPPLAKSEPAPPAQRPGA